MLPPCDDLESFDNESRQYMVSDTYLSVEGFSPDPSTGSDCNCDGRESGASNSVIPASGENSDATANGDFPVKAILCLTHWEPSEPIKATVILTTGVNQIVTEENKLIDVEDKCSMFKARANGRKWYITAFTLKNSQKVREQLMIKWNEMLKEQASLYAIEPHVLFSSGEDGSLVYMHHDPVCNDGMHKVQFIGLNTSLKKGYSHINVYSHLRREKALHDYRMKNDNDYLSFWGRNVRPNPQDLLDKFYPPNNPGVLKHFCEKREPVSFFLPTIQVGFYTGERRHISENIKVIYYQNSYDDKDYHHKFPRNANDDYPIKEKLLMDHTKYLIDNWSKIVREAKKRWTSEYLKRQQAGKPIGIKDFSKQSCS